MATYPFPFLTASPSFPYAATYPYPLPASAYTPPPGFFPAPAYGPSTTSSRPNFPVASGKNFSPPVPPIPPAHHTSSDCSIPSRSLPSSPDSPLKPLPVLSSSKFYGDLSLRSPPCGRPKLQQHKEGGRETEDDDGATMCYSCTCQTGQSSSVLHPATPDFTCQGGDLTKGNNAGGETISDEKFVRKHTGPGIFPMSNAGTDHGFVTHQALQGELSKLSNLVSQFAAAMGMQTTEAPLSTGSSPAAASTQFRSPAISPASSSSSPCDASFAVPTPMIASVSVTSPSTVPSATAYTALHVFGEMPQQYDFHNLSRKTVLLADGTERSYFTLPADYPLEQAVPEPVFDIYDEETEDCSNAFVDVSASTTEPLFSNEFVDVLASTPDQQLYEEEQPETEHSSACLNISSDVRDFTLELLQQDDERACNCSILKAFDSLVTRSTQLGEHSMRQLRLQWNPGVHTTQLSNMFDSMTVYDEADNDWQHSTLEQLTYEEEKQESDEPPKCFSKASETASLEVAPDFACANAFDCILEQHHDDGKTYGCQPLIVSNLYAKGYSQFNIGNSMIPTSMSDSALPYTNKKAKRLENVKCIDGLETPQLQYEQAHIFLSAAVLPEAMMAIPPSSTQRSYWLGHVLLKLPWDPGDINTRVKDMQMVAYNSIRLKSLEAFSEYYSEVFNRDLASNFTAEMSSDVVLHDPGIKRYAYMYSWLEIFSKFEKPLQFTQGTVPLALRYQLTMSSTTYIWDPGVKISLYSWLNILTVWSATDKQLSCTHIPDLAAWPNQSGTSSASYIMDPGTMLLQYKLLFIEEKEMVTLISKQWSFRFNAMHYCQIFEKCITGIALWLIHFQPP